MSQPRLSPQPTKKGGYLPIYGRLCICPQTRDLANPPPPPPQIQEFKMSGSDNSGEEPSSFGSYQLELYKNGALLEELPVVTTNPSKLEQQARETMPSAPFNYIYGGAGEGATMDANRLAFRQWKLIPRFLRPTIPRDLSVKLFGQTYREKACSTNCELSTLIVPSDPYDYGACWRYGCIPR